MSALSLIRPPPLREGATIGLLAPASPPLEPEKIPEAIARLTAQGFRVKPSRHLEKRDGYLAGSDQERAADLNAFFADPEVDAIVALRGGYGSIRILPLLDYAAIRAHPKIMLGYSDITALHHAILKEAGMVTFHGPNASEAFLPSNTDYLRAALLNSASNAPHELFSEAVEPGDPMKMLVHGCATGPVIGGNMTSLVRLLGTPYMPDFRGVILFLEDIGEKAYRVDGAFTQLRLAGLLDQIAGLVLGDFYHEDEKEYARIDECLQREARAIGVPCVYHAPIGHFPEQIVIPHGAQARFDANARTLNLL